ncbi:MAG: hypothetical protein ACT4P1_04685 [Sporichthyaceae bacterium]
MSSVHAPVPDLLTCGRSTSFWSMVTAALAGVAVLGLPKDEPVGDEWLNIELGTLLFY